MITSTASVRAGDLVLVTSGEYSDFGVIALCRAVIDFDAKALVPVFREGREDDSYDNSEFGDWLIKSGRLEKVSFRELYVGAYHAEPSIAEEPAPKGEEGT